MESEIINNLDEVIRYYNTVFWISAILSLVVLVCFFILCYNVAKIRKILEQQFPQPTESTESELTESLRVSYYKKTQIDILKLERLNKLISKPPKELSSVERKLEIVNILDELVNSQEEGLTVIDTYSELFNRDLIVNLIGLSSHFDTIREYLRCFIEYKIVKPEYPHKVIVKAQPKESSNDD